MVGDDEDDKDGRNVAVLVQTASETRPQQSPQRANILLSKKSKVMLPAWPTHRGSRTRAPLVVGALVLVETGQARAAQRVGQDVAHGLVTACDRPVPGHAHQDLHLLVQCSGTCGGALESKHFPKHLKMFNGQ